MTVSKHIAMRKAHACDTAHQVVEHGAASMAKPPNTFALYYVVEDA